MSLAVSILTPPQAKRFTGNIITCFSRKLKDHNISVMEWFTNFPKHFNLKPKDTVTEEAACL
jgi:hypothetical protein